MGIRIPKTLVMWASPFHITLAIWVRVRVGLHAQGMPISLEFGNGDAHITVTPAENPARD